MRSSLRIFTSNFFSHAVGKRPETWKTSWTEDGAGRCGERERAQKKKKKKKKKKLLID
jgi:hypothetical protein